MYNIKNKFYSVTNQEIIDRIKKYQKEIIFYLSDLTERKTGYLYYPIFNLKNKTLIFTNVKNDQKKFNLIKPINPKVIIKTISIKDDEVWKTIKLLLNIFSCTTELDEELLYNDIRVFKIYDIINYLRKCKFDLSDLKLSCNIFNTVHDNQDDKKTKKLFCYIERDIAIIMILKNINKLYKTSTKIGKSVCIKTEDIDNSLITNNDFKKSIELENNKFNIVLENKVHLVNKTLYNKIKKMNIEEYKLYYIKDNEWECYNYFIRILSDKFTLLSGYPNLKLFAKTKK